MHTALAANGIQLIDEYDAWSFRLRLLKQIPNPRRADADEHFHEVTATQRKKRHSRLTRHRPTQQRLARARRTHQEDAFGNFGADGLVTGGVLQKINNLLQLILGFLAASHVIKSDA